jgi:HD superfamily phosphodiesterase
MNHDLQLASLLRDVVSYDRGDSRRIQHLLKVHDLSRAIGLMERLDAETLFCLEAAALVHDIGIHACEGKYEGRCGGKLQELEGPPIARTLLEHLDFPPAIVDRVCFLVGHHHTYTGIDGLDYRILVESDFLVNLHEDAVPLKAVEAAYRNVFRTRSGRQLCRDMFGLVL